MNTLLYETVGLKFAVRVSYEEEQKKKERLYINIKLSSIRNNNN